MKSSEFLLKREKMEINGKIWLTPAEAAEYIGVSEGTLANYRSKGLPPKYSKPIGKVYYFKEDLDNFLKQKGN